MESKKILTRKTKRNLFFGLMVTVPIIMFIIFYGIVNFNTILLAFKKYEPLENGGIGYDVSFAGLANFKMVFTMLSYGRNSMMITNSLILWAFKLCVGLSVSIIFSYYVYKKAFGSKFFRIVLFLPNIVSNLIMVYLFRYFVDNALVTVFHLEVGLLSNPDTKFATILFFNLWLGFAGQTLMLTSSMSSIDESVVEASAIDGVNAISELFYVTIPMIYPTVTTFIIIGIAEIFVDQMSLLTFFDKFGVDESTRTVGYYLFQQAYETEYIPATHFLTNKQTGKLSYSELSAFGVMISCIIIPISFGARKLLNSVGPYKD